MPYVDPVPVEQAGPEPKVFYEQVRENFGFIPNYFLAVHCRT